MPDALYHRDIVGWSAAQADRLRRLARGERVNDLDWENVIEEVESVGRSELKSARSLLRRALEHALKLHGWPDNEAAAHWRSELNVFWLDGRDRVDPGMMRRLDLDRLYEEARQLALGAGLPEPQHPLPEAIVLHPRDVRNRAFGPRDLLARIAAGA